MKNYLLTPSGSRWQFSEAGGGLIATYETKEYAVQQCSKITHRETGSLKIFLPDGSVEEERTYGR